MKKMFALCVVSVLSASAIAQNDAAAVQAYGKIDKSDIEFTKCDFEPDANAEILFDEGEVSFTASFEVIVQRHIRIKIFNDKGKGEGNVRLNYYSRNSIETINNIEGETINLNNGQLEFLKLDKKNIYNQRVDGNFSAMTFSLPNVQVGSVIEFKYTLLSRNLGSVPDWYFQHDIPTRFSIIKTNIPHEFYYKNLVWVNQPYAINSADVKALANVHSLPDEMYMTSRKDNLERIQFQLSSGMANVLILFSSSWRKLSETEMKSNNFGNQLDRRLTDESSIVNAAKKLKSTDAKIAYLFNEVKNRMKWNEINAAYTYEGTSEAWDKKTGNATEINLILYHLLRKSGIDAFPMKVSTRKNGKVNPSYPDPAQFNRTVAYVPVDSAKYYVLDATSKYNVYNEVPENLLNGMGFVFADDDTESSLKFLENTGVVRQSTSVTAEIKADGTLTGTATINSFDYNKSDALQKYNTDGEKLYREYLTDNDNSLMISSLKFENMAVDSLPLVQNINFKLDLSGSDSTYLYVSTNLFSLLRKNPFLSDKRYTDIDFGYYRNHVISTTYKTPAGFQIDALPASVSMTMPDKSISFKRIVIPEEGQITVRYFIAYKKSIYFKEGYPEFYSFTKKMYELLNEQIVLKKI